MARKSFHEEIDRLEEDLLAMGSLVEEAVEKAVLSLRDLDEALADEVVAGDDRVDDMELDIEQRCLGLLALQQPMASDLRTVGTILKIVTDLERMADHAVDIARTTKRLSGQTLIKPLVDIPRMAELVKKMVHDSLNAFVRRDPDAAYRMVERDHEVDNLYSQIFRELLVIMMEDPRTIRQATHLLFAASALERIGDHATNLGEWTIYMVTGERKELNK